MINKKKFKYYLVPLSCLIKYILWLNLDLKIREFFLHIKIVKYDDIVLWGELKTVHIEDAFTAVIETLANEKSGWWSIKVRITFDRYHLVVEINPPIIILYKIYQYH